MSADGLKALTTLLGQNCITEPVEMAPYLTSWRNGWQGKTPLIALPTTAEQVSAVVKICHAHRIGIVPQGGNTGLVGGAIPSPDNNEIILSLARLNKVRAFDAVGSTVTVEAGVILQNLQEAAEQKGFLFPLSIASQGSAQVGGIISTNAGGVAVLRYGMMRNLVLGLEVVLPDGSMLSNLKQIAKDNTGYALAQYFIGAEGTLGVITAATLKLFPKPQASLTAIAAIPDAATALALLGDFRAAGAEYLSAFEIMAADALALVAKHIPGARLPTATQAPYYLLIQMDASSAAVPLRDIFESVAGKALEKGAMLDAVLAENTGQAKQFWTLRESISEATRKQGSSVHCDIGLPLPQIADFLIHTETLIKAVAPTVRLIPFGHVGDGNLHYNMYFEPALPPEQHATVKRKIHDIVYAEITKRGGSISAEHGIGVERRAILPDHKSAVEIELMKTIKRALDPFNLMNPGKIFNSL